MKKKRLALCSSFDQSELSVSSLFIHETLAKLERSFNIVKFSEEQDKTPIHSTFLIDKEEPFDCSLVLAEDRPGCLNYRFFSIAVPGATLLIDGNFDRLYFEYPWQFQDLSEAPLLKQVVETSIAIATINEHVLSNVSNLNLPRNPILLGVQAPVSEISPKEEELIQQYQSKNQFNIGYAARYFNEEKSFEVVECLLSLLGEGVNAKIVWMGRKNDVPSIKNFITTQGAIRQLNLTDLIEVVTTENFIEERETLCRTDVFLSLRKDFLHSPPTSFYHALALGIPTITTELGSTSSIPNEGVLFIPTGKGEDLAIHAALNAVRTDPSLQRSLSIGSKHYTDLVHNPELVASDLITILESTNRHSSSALGYAWCDSRQTGAMSQ